MKNDLINEIRRADHDELLRLRREAMPAQADFALEIAGNVEGIRFINDSSATGPVRVAESLASFSKPVVWIAEANAYLRDLSQLAPLVRDKVNVVIVKGSRADEAHDMLWPGIKMFLSASTWDEAVDLALLTAEVNSTVLFSPGCRADEPFADFRERGAYFNRLIDIKRKTKITMS